MAKIADVLDRLKQIEVTPQQAETVHADCRFYGDGFNLPWCTNKNSKNYGLGVVKNQHGYGREVKPCKCYTARSQLKP